MTRINVYAEHLRPGDRIDVGRGRTDAELEVRRVVADEWHGQSRVTADGYRHASAGINEPDWREYRPDDLVELTGATLTILDVAEATGADPLTILEAVVEMAGLDYRPPFVDGAEPRAETLPGTPFPDVDLEPWAVDELLDHYGDGATPSLARLVRNTRKTLDA